MTTPNALPSTRRTASGARLARHLFTLCSAVSLLLCVAVCALWARSYHGGVNDPSGDRGDIFPPSPAPAAAYLHSVNGTLRLRVCDGAHPENHPATAGAAAYRPVADEVEYRATPSADGSFFERGFAYAIARTDESGVRPYAGGQYVPFWSLNIAHRHALLTSAVLPLSWLIWLAWRQRRYRNRVERGLCPSCGYDRRASPERCPECGTSTAAPAA